MDELPPPPGPEPLDDEWMDELKRQGFDYYIRMRQGGDAREEKLEIIVLGKLLGDMRRWSGQSQEELAAGLGISHSELSLAEYGNVDIERFDELFPTWATMFGQDPKELRRPEHVADLIAALYEELEQEVDDSDYNDDTDFPTEFPEE